MEKQKEGVKKEELTILEPAEELARVDVKKGELKDEVLKLVQTAGSLELTDKQKDILFAPVKEDDVEIRPDGLIYLPWMEYVTRLKEAFGMSWGVLPLDKPKLEGNLIIREYCLIIKGVLMALAFGEQQYYSSNPTMSWGDAIEGCKSNALMRLCKGIGISLELWKPSFIRSWKKRYAKSEERFDERAGKKKLYWYKANEETPKEEPKPKETPKEVAPSQSISSSKDTDKRDISPAQINRLYAMMKAAGMRTDQEAKDRLLKYISQKILKPQGEPPISHFSDIKRWVYAVICEEIQEKIDGEKEKKKVEIISKGEKAYKKQEEAYRSAGMLDPEPTLDESGYVDLG